MPVTGDVSFNFATLENINPYTNSSLTVLSNEMQILDGGVKITEIAGGPLKVAYTGNAPDRSGIIGAKSETFNSVLNESASHGAALFITSGPDAGKGYLTRMNNGEFSLNKVDALGSYGSPIGYTKTYPTQTATATQEIELHPDGTLIGKYNGVPQITKTVSEYVSGVYPAFHALWGTGNSITTLSFAADGVVTSPFIANVDGDNIVMVGQTGVVISGANFGANTGSAKLELITREVTTAQTVTSWSSSAIVFDVVQGNNPYGNTSCKVTLSTGIPITKIISLEPSPGSIYKNAISAITDSTSLAYQAGAVSDNDMIEVPALVNGSSLAINFNWTFSLTPAISGTGTFVRRIWKSSTRAWEAGTVIVNNAAVESVLHVTNIDIDDRIYDNQPLVEINGYGFGVSQGAVTIGGVAQPITSWTDTKITLTYVEVTGLPVGAATLVVTKAI